MSNLDNWPEPSVAVDLDGTLAEYHGWKGKDHVGEPVPLIVKMIKHLIANGTKVKIFTARCWQPENIPAIEKWLEDNGIGGLEITNVKDPGMTAFYDDRAFNVEFNTGVIR